MKDETNIENQPNQEQSVILKEVILEMVKLLLRESNI